MATFEVYRRSAIGMSLIDSLDEMVYSGAIKPELAHQVVIQFDKSITEAVKTKVASTVSIKGHLHTYRFCDNVWTFNLQNAQISGHQEIEETINSIKIVACDSKLLTK